MESETVSLSKALMSAWYGSSALRNVTPFAAADTIPEFDVPETELDLARTQFEKLHQVPRRAAQERIAEKLEVLSLCREVPVDLVDAIEAGSQISSDDAMTSPVDERQLTGLLLECVAPDHMPQFHWHVHEQVFCSLELPACSAQKLFNAH
jgi:hypothetical protein